MRANVQEPDLRRERWASGQRTAKPISIKGAERKFGGCAQKAVELTSGDPLQVAAKRLGMERFTLNSAAEVSSGRSRSCSRQRLVRHSKPKGGATDRPSRERRSKAQTVLREEDKESDE